MKSGKIEGIFKVLFQNRNGKRHGISILIFAMASTNDKKRGVTLSASRSVALLSVGEGRGVRL